ncbi:protein JINGUBANG-like [Zingiber officinale]|uniref:Uncharacterized protein n=1 Tax=Zingiber officinale TaxID=94328 RepID=A0A8J5ESJ1_ZINOF|nr:protein JINGUBANG-like [Zingiber officinale]KAG6473120.1 hypothetical protein ZIOFF_067027 [Zingiber officinale]
MGEGSLHASKLLEMFRADAMVQSDDELPSGGGCSDGGSSPRYHSDTRPPSGEASPNGLFPWSPGCASPFAKSPWAFLPAPVSAEETAGARLVGSLVREEGHIYSLAAAGGLLYAGSESRNVRVWKGQRELSGFKSSSGLVKAIVLAGERIFTGHQDGKIRVWRKTASAEHKRVGTLPRLRDFLRSSINPSNYVEVRRHRRAVWLRHFDAVSCLSLDEKAGVLYSGSWDKTVKVWRISDSKCLESIKVHDDAVNSVATGFGGILFTGSADGTMKVWRREAVGKTGATRHVLVQTLLQQESAVTSVAVAESAGTVYCGSSDGSVHYWRWEGARRRLAYGGALRGHRMAVLCLAAKGSLVVSGSADNTLCVWRREEGTGGGRYSMMAELKGHEGPVKCLVVEEEGDRSDEPRYVVYSGSLDKSVKVWQVVEWEVTAEEVPEEESRPSLSVKTDASDGTWHRNREKVIGLGSSSIRHCVPQRSASVGMLFEAHV